MTRRSPETRERHTHAHSHCGLCVTTSTPPYKQNPKKCARTERGRVRALRAASPRENRARLAGTRAARRRAASLCGTSTMTSGSSRTSTASSSSIRAPSSRVPEAESLPQPRTFPRNREPGEGRGAPPWARAHDAAGSRRRRLGRRHRIKIAGLLLFLNTSLTQ